LIGSQQAREFKLKENMSTPKAAVLMSHLNDNHKAQMTTYLKFARSKRDENVGEVMHEFDDIKELRLTEDMYSIDDVRLIVGTVPFQLLVDDSYA
jgi:hypothetical protein